MKFVHDEIFNDQGEAQSVAELPSPPAWDGNQNGIGGDLKWFSGATTKMAYDQLVGMILCPR